jgi:hypothetical protein
MKVGFWIRDFHVLQTEVEIMMDLIGNRMRIWVTISTGKESQFTFLSAIVRILESSKVIFLN